MLDDLSIPRAPENVWLVQEFAADKPLTFWRAVVIGIAGFVIVPLFVIGSAWALWMIALALGMPV